jgi:hypothetical protein
MSGGYALPSHCGGSGSIPCDFMWYLSWTKWHWSRYSSKFLKFLLLILMPPLLHSHLSLSPELGHGSDQAAHYYVPWLWPGCILLCSMALTRLHVIMFHGSDQTAHYYVPWLWPGSTLLCSMALTRQHIMYHDCPGSTLLCSMALTRQHIIKSLVSEVWGFMFLTQHLAGHTDTWFWSFWSEFRLRLVVPAR